MISIIILLIAIVFTVMVLAYIIFED